MRRDLLAHDIEDDLPNLLAKSGGVDAVEQ
jgi:hypothetical protein